DNHGFDDSDGPHLGDMPNIAVGEDAEVTQSFLVKEVNLDEDGDHSSLADGGTSLIIHDEADDGESQLSGVAGDMIISGPIVDVEVTQSLLVKEVTLDEDGDHSLLADGGTSSIIHEGADDGESQPSGDAGDMIVCGPIVDDEE